MFLSYNTKGSLTFRSYYQNNNYLFFLNEFNQDIVLRIKAKEIKPREREASQNLLEHSPTIQRKQLLEPKKRQLFKEIFDYGAKNGDFFIGCIIGKNSFKFGQTKLCKGLFKETDSYALIRRHFILMDVSSKVLQNRPVSSLDLEYYFLKQYNRTEIENFEKANPNCFNEVLEALQDFLKDVSDIAPLIQNENVLNKAFLLSIREKIMVPDVIYGHKIERLKLDREGVDILKTMVDKIPK